MKPSLIIATAIFSLAASTGMAQSHNHAGHAPASPASTTTAATPATTEMAEAEVRRVDKDAKKVLLKHGPIKNLDMPGMTMVFQVRDEKLFDKLVAGEKIRFSAEQQQGAYVVTSVEKTEVK